MKDSTRLLLAFIIVFAMALPVFARGMFDISTQPPTPTLLSPNEKVDLSGKATLKFKWYSETSFAVDHLEFRIYKGNVATAENLIFKQDLSMTASSIEVKSDLFDIGQVYTWTLRLLSRGGQKSDKSFDTFEVIKK